MNDELQFWKQTAYQLNGQTERALEIIAQLCDVSIKRLDAFFAHGDRHYLEELNRFFVMQRRDTEATLKMLRGNGIFSGKEVRE